MEEIKKIVKENPDSMEIGKISDGGKIKIYGSFDNKEEFKQKIDNAVEIKQYAISKLV